MRRTAARGEEGAAPESLLAAIADAMPERAVPRCRHFGACGGCQLQHLPAAAQPAAKTAMLAEVLAGAGIAAPAMKVHAADPWHYRNRARLRVVDGRAGYSRRSSHEFLPIEECPILSPLIWHAVAALDRITHAGKSPWPAGISAIECFTNADESQMQISMQLDATVTTVDRDAPQYFRALCEALHADLPQLIGAGLSVAGAPDPAQPRRVQESSRVEIAKWGEPALLYQVKNRGYTISRNAFFQVNRFLTGAMVDAVVSSLRGSLAYDLFAGAGLFSLPLTEHFARVIAVEAGEPAASDLLRQLRAAGPPHQAVRSTALGFLQRQAGVQAQSPDLVVVDPPRAGLGVATVRALLQVQPREVVYVSCDPASFALDARTLLQSGYTLDSLQLFDLFPQTFHTETIAVLRR